MKLGQRRQVVGALIRAAVLVGVWAAVAVVDATVPGLLRMPFHGRVEAIMVAVGAVFWVRWILGLWDPFR
jgi:hypothetical protein